MSCLALSLSPRAHRAATDSRQKVRDGDAEHVDDARFALLGLCRLRQQQQYVCGCEACLRQQPVP
jgi:hypothetical protein